MNAEGFVVPRHVLYGGAAGGGKDFLACVWHIYRRVKFPNTRGFIGRETHRSLMGSTFNTFVNILKAMGIKMGVDCKFEGRTGELKWFNGSSTIFGYLQRDSRDPDYNYLGSFEYHDVIVNEAVECEKRAVEVLSSRIRYSIGANKNCSLALLLLSNPMDCWLKNQFIKDVNGVDIKLKYYQCFIQAKLKDNVDKDFRNSYFASFEGKSEYDKARLIEGDWDATPKIGGEFFDEFNHEKHVGEILYNRELPLWVSVDNNVQPYIAVTIWQSDKENKKLYQIGEVCAVESSATNSGNLCADFLQNTLNHQGKVFVTGDPSTRSRNTINEDKQTFIDLFSQSLRDNKYTTVDRMLSSAPSVYTSGDFVNQILKQWDDWKININKDCRQSITDYLTVKKDKDGSMLKERARNEYGSTFEKNGHLSDTFRYFIISCLEYEYDHWKNRNNLFLFENIEIERTKLSDISRV